MTLDLDLDLDPATFHLNRQSPASALPPSTALYTPPQGDYSPINPDINKATPPRYGSLKRVKNPFKVSERDSPPVTPDKLSPNHVFGGGRRSPGDQSDISGGNTAAEDGSSVCSADSAEFGQIDELPHPNDYRESGSPFETYSKVQKPKKDVAKDGPTDLEDIAIGSLDYQQLMNYFEDLRESAA